MAESPVDGGLLASEADKTSTKNFRVSDGDWICPDKKCANVNFARRANCNRCGREKSTDAKMMKAGGTEIGKTLAEKSRGLFSANDWQCKTCGNVNWARRSECNMCNTPKYAKLEERTGYGGGFNERENVEYIEREESDGEYDEFGRKKKKYRGKPVAPKTVIKVEEKETDGEEEDDEEADLSKYKLEDDEEEDEDEDDADLSKYNLDASDEEDENKNKKTTQHSRSNSRSSHSPSSSHSSSHSSSRSRSRSSSKSPKKRSYSSSPSSSSPERGRKRSRSGSASSGDHKKRRSRSRSTERRHGSSGSSHSGSSSSSKKK
ncbi:zinc finger Ran-binding domain-containing protein 2 [Lissotriton helveticus]